jgi:ribosomal protein S18 acetylase RimI-like enzyme
VIGLRLATPTDHALLLPRCVAFNAHEGLVVDAQAHAQALARLLGDPTLGGVWVIEQAGAVIGYAVVTFGYDLEFGGRDAYLTEIWVDPEVRGGGAGADALELLAAEVGARGVHALHLQVRTDNPALRLYQRAGFVTSPRITMTRTLR